MNARPIIPVTFTFAALVAGFMSIIMTAGQNFEAAAKLIMLALLLDGLDGTLARMLKATTRFGGELDTYVDFTAFGLAPAFLAYEMVLKDAGLGGLLLACAIVASGAARLSRFRVVDPYRGQRGYLGLPITVNAGWIALFVIVAESGFVSEDWLSLTRGPSATFLWTCVTAMVFLQVSRIRYGKPTKNLAGMIPGVILITAVFSNSPWGVAAALVLLATGFYFAFVSPWFTRRLAWRMAYDEIPAQAPR